MVRVAGEQHRGLHVSSEVNQVGQASSLSLLILQFLKLKKPAACPSELLRIKSSRYLGLCPAAGILIRFVNASSSSGMQKSSSIYAFFPVSSL